ncbi:hypothetical protein EDD15DRAFT_2199201 [Pisolithus albus]|nr:hypothetical protein EDD15DRAFT_2199201 [Pisolithus albus]
MPKVPSLPVEPNQEPQANLFERTKVAEVPEPPTSHASQPDLFERMRNATVPPAPSPYNDVSGPNEDITGPSPGPASQSDLFKRMRNATVPPAPHEQNEDSASPSPPPASQSDLFERMRKATVPPAPSPYMDVSDQNDDTTSRSPVPASQSDLYKRMRNATVPPAPCPDNGSVEDEDNVESDLFRRLQAARIPPPPDVHAVEISEQMEDVRAPSPSPASGSELFEQMRMAVVPPAPINPGEHNITERSLLLKVLQNHKGKKNIMWTMAARLTSEILKGDTYGSLWLTFLHGTYLLWTKWQIWSGLDWPPTDAQTMRIASEIREGANLRMLRLKECEYTLEIIDILEPYSHGPDHPSRQALIEMAIMYMGCQTDEDVSEWPAQWFSNISSDLRELDHLVLICICVQAEWKDVEDEFQNELCHIPKESFQLLNNLGSFIPNWTLQFPDKYGRFAFPWWLHGTSRYSIDFEELRGVKVFQMAAEYFQACDTPVSHACMSSI